MVKLSSFSMEGKFFRLAISRKRNRKQKNKLKLSSFSMDGTCSQQHNSISRKRKQKQKDDSNTMQGIDGDDLRTDKQNSTDNIGIDKLIDDDLSSDKEDSSVNIGIDKLPDDILAKILSRMSLKEAARTSVLSRRWKYLWTFAFATLEFDGSDAASGTVMKRKKFKSWVNAVLKFYQPSLIYSLIIRFSKIKRPLYPMSTSTYRAIDSWVSFAVRKEVQRFELVFSPYAKYKFPNIQKLLSLSREVKSPFRSLRSLRLVHVDIKDDVVHYFLASCPHLEQLCISASDVTKSLQFVDPLPNLKALEITNCYGIQSVEISVASLVSFAYSGEKINLLFKKIPNLSELSFGEYLADSFIFEPNEHSSYSVQLVKLVLNLDRSQCVIASPDLPRLCSLKRLELKVLSEVRRSLLFFTSLIKASPQLHEFRIKMCYAINPGNLLRDLWPFPALSDGEAVIFVHENLQVVEMAGYVGCSSEEKLLLRLFKIAPSLEKVVINTESDYYDDPDFLSFRATVKRLGYGPLRETGATTRTESKERAKHLVSTFPPAIKFVVE